MYEIHRFENWDAVGLVNEVIIIMSEDKLSKELVDFICIAVKEECDRRLLSGVESGKMGLSAIADTKIKSIDLIGMLNKERNVQLEKLDYELAALLNDAVARIRDLCFQVREDNRQLEVRNKTVQNLSAELSSANKVVNELRSIIGNPPDGSAPYEWKPRGKTWHEERRNWELEVSRLKAGLNDALGKLDSSKGS